MTVATVYSPEYLASGLSHFERFGWLHEQAQHLGIVRPFAPEPFALNDLGPLHDVGYVNSMASGIGPLARSAYLPWSRELLVTCLSMLGGQRRAVKLAIDEGRAINLACGFHHAHPERGGGFCVFNGLALVAADYPRLQVWVLDCDEHGGDGTEAFSARLANLHNVSIFGTRFGLLGGSRSRLLKVLPPDAETDSNQFFLDALDQALDMILAARPDLVLYQASVDSHQLDPKSTLLLTEQTFATRDQRVFRALASAGIPVAVTLGGGYQSPERVGALYLQTLRIAAHA